MTLIAIGKFSKMTRLSVKALRLYADNGLLPAASIDASTGYRFYNVNQAKRAEIIRVLRSIDMPLAEIKLVLDADNDERLNQQLHNHRQRLAERLAAQERAMAYLELLIKNKEIIMPEQVTLTEEQPQLIAATKFCTSLKTIGDDIATGFGTLMGGLAKAGLTPSGGPMILYHSVIDTETEGDIEVSVPVAAAITQAQDTGAVYTRELEGGTMACAIHHGRYDEIGPAYHALTTWVSEQGFEVAGPTREIYLNDPQQVPPEELLTRLAFPVHKSG